MLVLTRKPNQSIRIGADVTVNIIRVKGNTIQLGIDAPKDVHIVRSELLEKKDAKPASKAKGGQDADGAEIDPEIDRIPTLGVFRDSTYTSELNTAP